MRQSLKALLADSLDYAGMYPPACLSLEESFAQYTNYRQHEHAWLLARFVCAANRLGELESLLETSSSPAICLSVLGTGGAARDALTTAIDQDFHRIGTFLDRAGERARVETYERPLTLDFTAEGEPNLLATLDGVRRAVRRRGHEPPTIIFELPAAISHGGDVANLVKEFLPLAARHACGVKLRTGGAQASAFPLPSAVARFIAACHREKCGWKATAGLHEPLGELDRQLQVWRFGFFNLFCAAVLAGVHELSPDRIEPILCEANPTAFRLTDDSITWRELSATLDQITAARRESLLSFGSCSFDEPIAGLRRHKLLDE